MFGWFKLLNFSEIHSPSDAIIDIISCNVVGIKYDTICGNDSFGPSYFIFS